MKYPFDLDVYEFCSGDLQEKMKPFREVLKKQEEAKEEQKVALLENSSWFDLDDFFPETPQIGKE